MPTLDIKDGYCNPLLRNLEDLICRERRNYDLGYLAAVTSERNRASEQGQVLPLYNDNDTPVESCFRFYVDTLCEEDLSCAVGSEGICADYPEEDDRRFHEPTFADVGCWEKFWGIDPCNMNNDCFDSTAAKRARTLNNAVSRIAVQANQALLSEAITCCGGWWDQDTLSVVPAGTNPSFTVLGPSGQPSAIGFDQIGRFFRHNGCGGDAIVVTGDGALMQYTRMREASVYCCNDQGIDNSQIVNLLGGIAPFMDTTSGAAGEFTPDSGLAFAPGSIVMLNPYDNRGECTYDMQDYVQRTFVGPFGLIFDYFLSFEKCPQPKWVEGVRLNLQQWCKPEGLNDCEKDGTRSIWCMDFVSCAADLCA